MDEALEGVLEVLLCMTGEWNERFCEGEEGETYKRCCMQMRE